MATKTYTGKAKAVAQVSTVQVTAYDAATTYELLVNGIVIASTIAAGSANATATALAAAWTASTHGYKTNITATAATDTVTLTGPAGMPFTLTKNTTGGTGTLGSVATPTAATGPHHVSNAKNWSGDALPAASDDIVVAPGASILWDIEHLHDNNLDPASFVTPQTFTKLIGLNDVAYTKNADGTQTDSTLPEYRPVYLKMRATKIDLGLPSGAIAANGSGRTNINNTKASASTLTVHGTAATPNDAGGFSVKYLAAHANADVYIRSAPGGVGVAVGAGETSTVGKVEIANAAAATRVVTGKGVTLTSWKQAGGTNTLAAAATVTTIDGNAGVLTTEGDFTATTVNANGATVYPNAIKTSGNPITTLNINGGTVDGRQSNVARNIGTVNHNLGVFIRGAMTQTTYNPPAGERTLTAA